MSSCWSSQDPKTSRIPITCPAGEMAAKQVFGQRIVPPMILFKWAVGWAGCWVHGCVVGEWVRVRGSSPSNNCGIHILSSVVSEKGFVSEAH
jgi:hypothetical protein